MPPKKGKKKVEKDENFAIPMSERLQAKLLSQTNSEQICEHPPKKIKTKQKRFIEEAEEEEFSMDVVQEENIISENNEMDQKVIEGVKQQDYEISNDVKDVSNVLPVTNDSLNLPKSNISITIKKRIIVDDEYEEDNKSEVITKPEPPKIQSASKINFSKSKVIDDKILKTTITKEISTNQSISNITTNLKENIENESAKITKPVIISKITSQPILKEMKKGEPKWVETVRKQLDDNFVSIHIIPI